MSKTRIHHLVEDLCRHYAECDPDYFASSYDSQDECVASFETEIGMYADAEGKECVDLYLDWMECVAHLDCTDTEETQCAASEKKFDEACDIDDAGEGTMGSKSVGFRGLRIPR